MKRLASIAVITVAFGLAVQATSLSRAASLTNSIDTIAWLAGCWSNVGSETGSGEQWMAPAGGTMFGMSRFVRDGKTAGFEYMKISEAAEGALVFTAMPNGKSPTDFVAIEIGSEKVVFENMAHDFPQRVMYIRASDDRLLGRIEGTENGESASVEFPMTRSNCGNE
jgi:hypothetical protein